MSDLTVELRPENLTADELSRRCLDEIAALKRHRDPEQTCLKLAALVQAAVQRLRMGESHVGSPDRGLRDSDRNSSAGDARDELGHAIGGGWRSLVGPAGKSPTSLRPH